MNIFNILGYIMCSIPIGSVLVWIFYTIYIRNPQILFALFGIIIAIVLLIYYFLLAARLINHKGDLP